MSLKARDFSTKIKQFLVVLFIFAQCSSSLLSMSGQCKSQGWLVSRLLKAMGALPFPQDLSALLQVFAVLKVEAV